MSDTSSVRAKARYYAKNKQAVINRSAAWRKANPEAFAKAYKKCLQTDPTRTRRYALKRKYKITLEQYNQTLELQGGACAICLRKPPDVVLVVDHEHKRKDHPEDTGRVRGILCRRCNYWRIGRDRAEHSGLYTRAATYLTSTFNMRAL